MRENKKQIEKKLIELTKLLRQTDKKLEYSNSELDLCKNHNSTHEIEQLIKFLEIDILKLEIKKNDLEIKTNKLKSKLSFKSDLNDFLGELERSESSLITTEKWVEDYEYERIRNNKNKNLKEELEIKEKALQKEFTLKKI